MGEDRRFKILSVIPNNVELPFIAKFVDAHRAYYLCARMAAADGKPRNQFYIDENSILVRQGTTDCSLQEIVPAKLR